jgi:hypothetical protein
VEIVAQVSEANKEPVKTAEQLQLEAAEALFEA